MGAAAAATGTPAAVGAAAAATGAAAAAAAATAAGRCRSRPAAGAAELNWFEAAPSAAADKGFALFGLTGPSYTLMRAKIQNHLL